MLSPALELLARARQTTDEAEVDRLAVAAILADPDLAEAYLLRGEVAARQGDAVTAAHHFRAAWNRGDRSATTRAALAICLEVVGQAEAAAGMGAGASLPPSLETFGELARMMAPAIRGMLALPLPPPGEPALLPGERRPSGMVPRIDPSAQRPASGPGFGVVRPPSTPPAARPISAPPGPLRPPSSPPGAVGPPSIPPSVRSVSQPMPFTAPLRTSTPPRPATPEVAVRPTAIELPDFDAEPDWLETHHSRRSSPNRAAVREDWLDDSLVPMPVGEVGLRITPAPLELVVDPGPPDFDLRSPATGQAITRDAVLSDRTDALMPELSLTERFQRTSRRAAEAAPARVEPPSAPSVASLPPRSVDLLEAAVEFAEAGVALRMALELPGPVITAAGAKPQQLCAAVALGLTADELLMRDRQRSDVAVVRLPFRALRRMDLLREGAQLSFGLADGRQLHLDLRALRARAPALAQALVGELGAALRAVGAQVNT